VRGALLFEGKGLSLTFIRDSLSMTDVGFGGLGMLELVLVSVLFSFACWLL
jgi:hypothetical protein